MIQELLIFTIAICTAVQCLDAAWVRQFPVGVQLINGDVFRLPLDDYVNTKGSTFTVAPPGQQSWVIEKIVSGTSVALRSVGTTTPSACSIIIRPDANANHLIMLCNKNSLFKVFINPGWVYESSTDLALTGLGTTTTICTDMVITPSSTTPVVPQLAHLLCFDSASGVSGFTFIEVDISQSTWVAGTTSKVQANILGSTPNKSGYPRFTVGFIAASSKFVYYIWDAVPATDASSATPATTTSAIQRCTLTFSSYTTLCNAQGFSLSTLLTPTPTPPFGAVRYLRFYNDGANQPRLFYAVAGGSAGSRSINLGILGIDATDNPISLASTVAYSKLFTYNLSQWVADADANSMIGHMYTSGSSITTPIITSIDHFILVGRTNIFYISLSATIATGGINQIDSPATKSDWVAPFECTMPATSFPTRCMDIGGSIAKFDSRLIVEYRNPALTTTYLDNLVAVGVNFNYTKYGCLPTANGFPSGVVLASYNNLITFMNSNYIRNRMSPDTLLSLVMNNAVTTPVMDLNITLTAATTTAGTPTPSRIIQLKVAKKPEDYNTINLDSSVYRAYNGSNFTVPISPLKFNSNAPQLTIKSTPNVVLLNMTVNSPLFQSPMRINTPYSYNRVLMVDKDWAVVVLKSTGATDKEHFALVKVTYDDNGAPSFPIPTDQSTDPKISATGTGETIYKVLRLYDSFCLFFKGVGTGVAKLRMNCYKLALLPTTSTTDYPSVFTYANAATTSATLLASNVELIEMGVMLTNTRLTYYLICSTGTAPYDVRVGTITVTPSGSAASYSNPTELTQTVTLNNKGESLLEGYYPIDIVVDYWGQIDGGMMVTLRMHRLLKPPILARYNFAVSQGQTTGVLSRLMRLESQNVIFCSQKDEVVIYNPRARSIYSITWNLINGVTSGMYKFFYPLSLYKVASILQFNCIPERGIFQVLAKTSETPAKKIVVNFNGGFSWVGGKRVHSVIDVHSDTDKISTTSTKDSFYTYADTSMNPTASNRQLFSIVINGPLLRVVGPASPTNVTVEISTLPKGSATGATTAQASFRIDLSSAITFAKIYPKIKFDLSKGVPIKVDDYVDLPGPVIAIKKDGDTSQNLELLPRSSLGRRYTPTSQSVAFPTKVLVEGDFMVTIMSATGDALILGDPSVMRPNVPSTSVPITILELQTVRNGHLVRVPNSKDVVAVLVSYSITPNSPTIYYYDVYHLSVAAPPAGSTTATNTYTSTKTAGSTLFQTDVEYDTIHCIYIPNKGVVMAMSIKREFASNVIKLVYLQKQANSNSYVKSSEGTVTTTESRDISDYSLTYFNHITTSKVMASIVGHFKLIPGFFVVHWDLANPTPSITKSFTNMTTPATYVNSSTPETSLMLNFNYIKCFTRWELTMTVDCVVDAEGAIDYGITIEFNDLVVEGSEPIKSAIKFAEFETPPRFEVKRVEKGGEYYGFHLVRNEPILVAPTSIKKFDDCINILAYYKPSKNKYIYTATLCDGFGTSFDSAVDFAMENSDREYVYYTNSRSALEKIKADVLNSALLTVKGKIDAAKIKLTFIGLNGEDSQENQSMYLDELRFGSAPPGSNNTWIAWMIVLGVFILLGVGAYLAWVWYQGQQAASGASSQGYKAPDSHNSSAIHDSRL